MTKEEIIEALKNDVDLTMKMTSEEIKSFYEGLIKQIEQLEIVLDSGKDLENAKAQIAAQQVVINSFKEIAAKMNEIISNNQG